MMFCDVSILFLEKKSQKFQKKKNLKPKNCENCYIIDKNYQKNLNYINIHNIVFDNIIYDQIKSYQVF